MKKIIAIALFCISAFTVPAHAQLKIAVVDMQAIFKDYYKTQEAEKRIQDQIASFKKEREDRLSDYRKLVDQINALKDGMKDPVASGASKKDKEQKLNEKINDARTREQEISSYDQNAGKIIQDTQMRQRKQIVDEISKAIEDFSKGKYNMVLDKSGMTLNGTSTIVYQEGMTDISAEITKQLNSNKDKQPASAPAAKDNKTP